MEVLLYVTHRPIIGPIYAAIVVRCQDIVDESSSWNSESARFNKI